MSPGLGHYNVENVGEVGFSSQSNPEPQTLRGYLYLDRHLAAAVGGAPRAPRRAPGLGHYNVENVGEVGFSSQSNPEPQTLNQEMDARH